MPFVDQLMWLEGEDKPKAPKLLFKTFGFERTYAQYLSVYISTIYAVMYCVGPLKSKF